MMRRMLLAGMVLAVVVASTAGAGGLDRCPHADSPLGKAISGVIGRLMVLRSEANITDEQKAAIHKLLKDHRSQIAATVKSVRDKRLALRNAVLLGESDDAKIRAAADDLGKAIGDAALKARKLRNQIAPILTKEQQKLIGKCIMENDAAIGEFLNQAIEGK